MPVVSSNICSVVALGADDRSVSVWQTKTARPIVVAKEVFERQIMDLSWYVDFFFFVFYGTLSDIYVISLIHITNRSLDGLTLYAVSSDGTMAVLSFDAEELVGLAPLSAQPVYLKKFGFTAPPLPEGYSHITQPINQPDIRMTPPPSPGRASSNQQQQQQQTPANAQQDREGFGGGVNGVNGGGSGGGGEHINRLVAKRNVKKKKRVQLTNVPSAATGDAPNTLSGRSTTTTTGPLPLPQAPVPSTNGRSFHEIAGIVSSSGPTRQGPAPIQIPSILNPTTDDYSWRQSSQDVDMDLNSHTHLHGEDDDNNTEVQIDSLLMGDHNPRPSSNFSSGMGGKGKRKAGTVDFLLDGDRPPLKPRTLGGDRVRDGSMLVKEIGGGLGGSPVIVTGGGVGLGIGLGGDGGLGVDGRLVVPVLMTYLKVNVEGGEDVFEGQNSEDSGMFLFIPLSYVVFLVMSMRELRDG